MTTSPAPRQPRSRPAPSDRDQQIYIDYQATGRRQIDLASDYKLTQCRISQIIRRVERWLASNVQSPKSNVQNQGRAESTLDLGPGTLDSAANRAAFERRLERERLNLVCREAMRQFSQEQKTVTHKKGTRGETAFDETIERTAPPSVQCLKVVLQANRQLSRPVGRALPTTAPLEQDPAPSNAQRREEFEAWLTGQREDAQGTGKVSHDFKNHILVQDLVSAFLGESNRGLALHTLAREAGKKIVKRKPYDDSPPRLPPQDGWYYPMYDADGGLVAWLSADQMARVTAACGVDISCLEPAISQLGSESSAPEALPTPPSSPLKMGTGSEPNRQNRYEQPSCEVPVPLFQHSASSTCAPSADLPQVEPSQKLAPDTGHSTTAPPTTIIPFSELATHY